MYVCICKVNNKRKFHLLENIITSENKGNSTTSNILLVVVFYY